MSVVEQLVHGVKVTCADGTEVVVKALPLKVGMQIADLLVSRQHPRLAQITEELKREDLTDARRTALRLELFPLVDAAGKARIEIIRLFAKTYPELADHISAGDVEVLIPDFFYATTGAQIPTLVAENAPTGTSPSATTAPSGASSPT